MIYCINPEKCNLCSSCYTACMNNAIVFENEHFSIDQAWCMDCGSCKEFCTEDAIYMKGIDYEPPYVFQESYSGLHQVTEFV